MEIEKPFKCSVCNAHFTNEDHLSVHKKRHEMSLNLSKGQSTSLTIENFVDETPTPTRFFRNCEEVGLFQDLQNVNPFDEQFSKATSAGTTPSTLEPFDFSMALGSNVLPNSSTSANNVGGSGSGSGGKRRYSDQDTLNTPQVFGYLANSSSSMNCTGTTTTTTVTTTNSANKEKSSVPLPSEEKNSKLKATLKLNLSPSPISPSGQNAKTDSPGEKKSELQERNRAAALRSRERRKQWVNSLESRCALLEKLLGDTRMELQREKSDNQILRQELSKHVECEVTKASQSSHDKMNLVAEEAKLPSGSIINNSTNDIRKEALNLNAGGNGGEISIKPKAKRGRPRKGQERRVNVISIPPTPNEIPIKIQIFPVNHPKKS